MRVEAKVGDRGKAVKIADELFADIVGQGDEQAGMELERRIREAHQSEALWMLVLAMTEEELHDSVKIAEKILEPYSKARALTLVARVNNAEEERFDSIFDVVDDINDIEWQADALVQLAQESAVTGYPDVARVAARRIPAYLYVHRSEAAAAAAIALARESRFYEARVLSEECLPNDMIGVHLKILESRSQGGTD